MNHISKALRGVADKYNGVSLIIRIIVGLIAGTALALVVPHMTWIGEFGTLFVSALKAVAPILVFVLVASALAQGNSKLDGRFGTVLFLYLFTTFLSAVVAVLTSRMFPQTISLGDAADADVVPQGLSEVDQYRGQSDSGHDRRQLHLHSDVGLPVRSCHEGYCQ